jgi:general stress protein YciG
MQNIDNRKNSQQEIASTGGEPLDGSGFENEQPDPEFAVEVGPEPEGCIR